MGIHAAQFYSQITHCQSQVLHKPLQSCSPKRYVTSKRGKDAPSALVLEGPAASLIHSLQLHCWKRVQKEDQATRKQPQYLIWPDLAGRLLRLYICSSLTKSTGVSFFFSLYLFYGSPVNFSLYYENWREALPDGYVEALPISDWTQKPPCHISSDRVPQTCSYREKKTRGREIKAMLSAAIQNVYLMRYNLLQKVMICFLSIIAFSLLPQWPGLCTSSLMRLQLDFIFCYTKPSVGPGPTTLLTFSSLQPLVARLASWCNIAAHQKAGRAHEMGDKFSQMEWYYGIFSYKPQMPPFPLLKTQEIVCMWKKKNPSKAWEGRQCCCYF